MRRRRKNEVTPEGALDPTTGEGAAPVDPTAAPDHRAHGPWDSSERSVEGDTDRIDLGGLLVKGDPSLEVRLQVDEASQQVIAVMLVAQDGAMELRPFAAPRNEDMWADLRPRLAADAARRGGTATEVEGPFGPALQLVLSTTDEQGAGVTQRSAVWGVAGPRWLLRVTAFGRPAQRFDEDGSLERALREVVVVRGTGPMPPGDALPLRLPPTARRAPDQGADQASDRDPGPSPS
ncbi:DUF3710 domain-containing protein [Nocardioides sp. HDW12B]|uniref:DUF3710 domain-containing protein n=1 Tax=Nocardioides sp. HDW12B TaxID=2714939 RepID=UPI00140C705C|nr:DUF3710 domain-containing protein [Nocardioides sp. HDW12B]QIK66751.1 DUF3710 domain-containing protein [Nocardioides sp. HDW12B]